MSQDRKPARVRVMTAGAEAPQRRRRDTPPTVVNGNAASAPAGARGAAAAADAGGRRRFVLPLMFLCAAGVGGVAMTMLGFA